MFLILSNAHGNSTCITQYYTHTCKVDESAKQRPGGRIAATHDHKTNQSSISDRRRRSHIKNTTTKQEVKDSINLSLNTKPPFWKLFYQSAHRHTRIYTQNDTVKENTTERKWERERDARSKRPRHVATRGSCNTVQTVCTHDETTRQSRPGPQCGATVEGLTEKKKVSFFFFVVGTAWVGVEVADSDTCYSRPAPAHQLRRYFSFLENRWADGVHTWCLTQTVLASPDWGKNNSFFSLIFKRKKEKEKLS